jgi:hypothetical protein
MKRLSRTHSCADGRTACAGSATMQALSGVLTADPLTKFENMPTAPLSRNP